MNSPPSRDAPELSLVIPAHNESESLPALLAEVGAVLDRLGRAAEVIVVDDASDDASWEVLQSARRGEPRLRAIRLPARGGQSAALAAGFARARGEVVITLDADLQNDPADIPRLIEALGHADVVSGIRRVRNDSGWRRLSSRVANATRRFVIGDSITDIGCSLKAYRRETLTGLPPFTTMHRFLPALCQFRGARVVEIEVNHRARRHGVSRYNTASRLARGLADLVGVRWLKSRLVPPGLPEEDR